MITLCIKYSFSQIPHLHPYLVDNLQRRGMLPLKHFQVKSLEIINAKHNFFLNSCTGSGKTLSYLVPIINNILIQQDQKSTARPKGGLILTLNKQLVNQVYREIKLLDIDKRLSVARTGTLSQQKNVGIAQAKLTEGQKQEGTSDGIISFINWSEIDILVSTPQALMNQLTIYKVQAKNPLDPEFLVIDEADVVLQIDTNVRKRADQVISHVRKHSTNSSAIKYMLTASSFPKKYRGKQATSKLQQNFKTLKFIEGDNRHKLPQKLELFYIEIEATEEEKIHEQKMSYLKRILNDRKKQRMIIFCKKKETINQISDFIRQGLQSQCAEYYAQLRTEERAEALQKFDNGQCNILVSSQLGSRGLDFSLPVDCIIEFNMAENVTHFINRVGRTARNGLYGEVITFVQKKNQQFFAHLRTLKESGSEFDQLFSRKRSYSKLYKDSVKTDS